MSRYVAIAAAALLVVASLFVSADAAIITQITPKLGSVHGKTRVSILGEGFDIRGRSNDVYIGNSIYGVFCDPIPNECHESRIVCLTDAYPAVGQMPLSVRSFGHLAECKDPAGCTFEFTLARTPEVRTILPEWLIAPAQLTITGERFTQGDVSVGNFDFTTHLGDEERCNLNGQVSSTSFVCDVEAMRPGTLRVDVQLGASGRAKMTAEPVVHVFPSISGVSPSAGSINGGQVVTIFGTSFSPELSDNYVTIHGTPCTVTKVENEYIECFTQPHAATSAPAAVYEPGRVRLDAWFNVPGASLTTDLVSRLNYLFPTSTRFTTSVTNEGITACDFCGFQWTTYFTPLETGVYNFSGTGDDNFELWISTDETPVERKRDESASGNPADSLGFHPRRILAGNHPNQVRGSVTLEAGRRYWMRALVKENQGGEGIDYFVTLPNGTRTRISAAYLSYRPDWTPPVSVVVRDVPALLDNACKAWGACNFDYTDAATPKITSVSAAAVAPGDLITISGSGFSTLGVAPTTPGACTIPGCGGGGCECSTADECALFNDICQWDTQSGACGYITPPICQGWSSNFVLVNGENCDVTATTATQLVCKVPVTSGGFHEVQVYVEGFGRALGQAFVTVQQSIRRIAPASGSVNGQNTLHVLGGGFDAAAGVTSVTVGGAQCGVTSATPFELRCVVPAGTAGTADVKVITKRHIRAAAVEAYTYVEKLQRPGTTQVITTIDMAPMSGSTAGGTEVTIVLPSDVNVGITGTSVTFGPYPCSIRTAIGRTVTCITGAADDFGTYAGTLRYVDKLGATQTVALPSFVYRRAVTWVREERVSPFGARWNSISFDTRGVSKASLSIAIEGQPCEDIQYNVGSVECLVKPQPTTLPALTTIDEYNFNGDGNAFTNKLARVEYSPNVIANADGSVTIPRGGYVNTKRSYQRPFVFTARVKATKTLSEGGGRIPIRILVSEPTLSWSGVAGVAGALSDGRFGFRIDQWDQYTNEKEFNGAFSSIGLDSSTFRTYRMEAWNNWVNFYIDNTLIWTQSIRDRRSGSVGIGFANQDIIVDDFKIESLYPRALQVNVSGVPLANTFDVMYSRDTIPRVTRMSPTTVRGGQRITVTGSNFRNWGPLHIYALSSATETVTAATPRICVDASAVLNELTEQWEMTCTATSWVPAGNYFFLVANARGAAEASIAGVVQASVSSISPRFGSSGGRRITVSGSGFASGAAVKVGASDCAQVALNPTTIVCDTAPGTTTAAISVIQGGSTLSCATAANCAFNFNVTTGGWAESITPTTGGEGTEITITGTSFTAVTGALVGESRAQWCAFTSATSLKCRLGRSLRTGAHTIRLFNDNGFIDGVPLTFTYAAGATWSTPAKGSPNGGSPLRIYGTVLPTGTGATNVVSRSFTSAEAGWTSSSIYTCSAGSMLGRFGPEDSVSRTFSGLASHAAVRVVFKILSSGPNPVVRVDGATYTATYGNCVPNSCGALDDQNCYYEGSVVLPHTAATATLTFATTNNNGGWFGVISYSFDTIATQQFAVTVGGAACPIRWIDHENIYCTTPAGTGSNVPVRVVVDGVTHCSSCSFEYDATLVPTVRLATIAYTAGVTSAHTTVPIFAADANTRVEYSEAGATITKIAGGNSWNAGGIAPRPILKTDAEVVGVEFRASQTSDILMIGLGVQGRQETSSHWDISYAVYLNDRNMIIYEQGKWIATAGTFNAGDRITVQYERSCDCVKYTLRNVVVFTSNQAPVFPLVVDFSIHNANDRINNVKLLAAQTPADRILVAGDAIVRDSAAALTIANKPCIATYHSEGRATCWVAAGTVAIGDTINVIVNNRNGNGAPADVVVGNVVTALSHTSGSRNGGHRVTVWGGKFDSTTTVALAGAGSCSVVEVADAYVVCTTPSVAAAAEAAVTVSNGATALNCVSGTAPEAASTTTGCTTLRYSYTDAATPTITSVTPASANSGAVLTFAGTNFPVVASSATVKPTIAVGSGSCAVDSSTATALTCTLINADGGAHTPAIVFPSVGRSSTVSLTVPLTITSLSTTAAGTSGAARLVLTGTGFGAATSTQALTVQIGGVNLCSSITRADTTLTCVTNAGAFDGAVVVTIGATSATSSSTFTASTANQATVTSISPSNGGAGALVTITGTNLGGQSTVAIGAATCAFVSSSATSIVCTLGPNAAAGVATVSVITAQRGIAASSATFTVVLSIGSVSPAQGPREGGQLVTVTGSGFGAANETKVTVGGVPCTITSISAGVITCLTGPMGDADNRIVAVEFTDGTSSEITAPTQYTYDTSLTATVTAINPASGSASGEQLVTISGTGFSTIALSNRVTIGGTPCDVESVAADGSSIACRTRPRAPGANLAVVVVVGNQGAATNNATVFSAELHIDSIVGSADVSTEGGVALTLAGRGFWPIANADAWQHKRYELTVGGIACPIVSSTATQIICALGASPREYVTMPALVNAYPARPERTVGVALKGNGVDAVVASGVVVNFRASATATITSISPSRAIVNKGATITINGNGFATSGNTVKVGAATCDVTTQSATQIVCTLNSGIIGRGFVQVVVPGKGLASTQQACPAGQYLLCDGSCVSDSDCVYEAWGMTTCADLANLVLHDSFCHSNGGTDRVNRPYRTDSGAAIALNCPMYSCEGRDCNQTLFIGGSGGRISTCGADPNGYYLDFRALVSSATPKASSIGGGRRVTITGTSFGSDVNAVQAFVGNAMCVPLTVSDTEIVCETTAVSAALSGQQLRVAINGAAATCNDCSGFSYDATLTPSITSLAPAGNAVVGAPLTITGTGFSATAADNLVSVGASNCAVTSATETQIVCTTPNRAPGQQAVVVRVAGKGYSTAATATANIRTYALTVDSLSQTSGSTEGGATIVVSTTGSNADTRVAFGDCPTRWVSFNEGRITVVTTACSGQFSTRLIQGASSTTRGNRNYNFADAATPKLDAFATAGNTLTITISNFGTATQADLAVTVGDNTCAIATFAAGVITCTLPATHAAGTYNVVVTTAAQGAAKPTISSATFSFALTVGAITPTSGSRGGNQRVTLSGSGFDSVTPSNNVVTIGGARCAVVSATPTEIQCMTGKIAAATTAAPSVTVNHPRVATAHAAVSGSVMYVYDDAKTPVVNSVAPNRGSTAGGTRLTIGGSQLSKTLAVKINGVECTQSVAEQAMTDAAAGTMLFCTTGAHATMFEPALITVATSADGDAYNTAAAYQYIDLWSRWTTWGNTPPPIAGDSAVISEGQTVMIDYSPPRFYLIIVMGHLLLDDTKDITLECTYIMVNFGRFTVGTPQKPFLKKATIRLFGDRLTPEIPVHGAKVLAVRHGALDMHGEPRQKTWTTIAGTAAVGTSSITIAGPVDWRAGEFIVIASTDYDPLHAEERRIIGVLPANGQADRVVLQLEHPLKYEHFGERQCYDQGTKCIDEVAEVGLLTRNVVVEGDRHTQRLGFGATLFLMPMGETADRYCRLSYIEIRNAGQQFIVGRYPLHFHVTGSSNTSYANGTSIHHSLNRAFSVHGISNNTYVNNVAYDTHGHSFFIEDGSEKYNVITDNLVILSRVSTSNLNTDLTPANFWLVSPLNYVARNRAGGSQAYGYWISPFHPHSTGPTFSTSICPATHQLWAFYDNVGHSNKKYGINIFQFWWPKQVECDFNGPDAPAVLRNNVVYKNQVWGVTLGNHEVGEVGAVTFDNLTSADNGFLHTDGANFWIEHIAARNMTCGLQNSVLIALTGNQPHRRSLHRRGVNLPLGDNFFTENVTFINYDQENFGFEPQAWAERLSLCFPWGWEAVSRGLRWVNSPNRIRFRFHHHGVLNDDDGSLTGLAGSQIVPRAPIFDDTICTPPTGFSTLTASLVCPQSYKVRRFGISTMNELWTDQRWQAEGRAEIVPEILRLYLMTAPINKEIEVDHQWWYSAAQWDWRYGGTRFMRPNEKTLFKMRYNETRHHVYGTFNGALNKTWNRPMPTLADTTSFYAFDNETMLYRGLLALPQTSMVVNAFNCPDEGCPLPPLPPPAWEKPCGAFGVASSWTSGQVPADRTDVMIPYTDNICIGRADIAPPLSQCTDANRALTYNFQKLRVEGGFNFFNHHCPCIGAVVTINVEHYVWVRNGGILIGNETHPLTDCTLRFVLGQAPWNADPSVLSPYKLNPWGFRSFTLESGTISMVGRQPQPAYTRLAAAAAVGATTLTLEAPVDWRVGDVIAIAGTNRERMYVRGRARNTANDNEHSEHATITAISTDRKTLTLSAALKYPHHGEAPTTLNGKQYSIGAEVAVLSRTIAIEGGHGDTTPEFFAGWRFNIGCTPGNFEGCAAGTRDGMIGWPMEAGKPGYLKLDSILLRDVGQGGVLHGALQLDGLTNGANNAEDSYIRNIAMWRVYNTGISLRDGTTGMNVTNNVIYDVIGDGIRVAAPGNRIANNLVIKVGVPEPNCEDVHFIFEDCRTAAYRLHAGTIATGNIAASGVGAGFSTIGINCDLPLLWANNVAHSFRDGLLTYTDNTQPEYKFVENHPTVPQTCRKVGGVMAYWIADHGLAAWYAVGNLEVENFIAVDSAIGSFAMTLHSGRFQRYTPTTKYTNVAYAGYFTGHKCRDDTYRYICTKSLLDSKPWCSFFQDSAPYMGNIGMMETIFTTDSYGIGKTKGEQKFRWTEMDSYATISGQATINGVHFANFDGQDECGLKNVGFYQNPFSNDTFHHHVFEKVSWSGITNGGHVWTRRTYGENKGHWYMDFDNIYFGGYWPDSPNKIWLADKDGSFTGTGKPSSVLSSETITRESQFRDLRWDGRGFQAGRLPPARAGCTWKAEWNAFQCDESYKWINIGIDSLADDELTRRAAPVVLCKGDGMIEVNGDPICQGGVVDYVSGPVMKGKTQRATLDRMSRWQFIAEDGGNYTLAFRGQPPTHLRLVLQNHEYLGKGNNVGVTLNLRYFGLNSASRVGVYVNGVRQRPSVGYDYPHLMRPAQTWPAPTDTQGTHFHDKYVDGSVIRETGQGFQRNVLYFTLRPGSVLELKQEPIVQINMDVSVPEDEFFNNKETFVAAMASVLGITEDRLKFAKIVPGTTRRRQGSFTSVGMEVDKPAGAGQEAFDTGRDVTTDFDAIVARAATLNNQAIGGMTVSGVTATIVVVRNPRPPITVLRGTPFISMNVSKTNELFNTTQMQTLTHAWVLSNLGSMGMPYNITDLSEVAISNVFTDRDTMFTQLAIVLAYENNNHTKLAMDRMFEILNVTTASLFPGWEVRDLAYSLNGWVAEGEVLPETLVPPSATTNKIDQETLIKFAIGLGIGIAVVFVVGGSLMYYFVSVRPRKLAKAARAKKLAMHEVSGGATGAATNEPKNPAQAMFTGRSTPNSEPIEAVV